MSGWTPLTSSGRSDPYDYHRGSIDGDLGALGSPPAHGTDYDNYRENIALVQSPGLLSPDFQRDVSSPEPPGPIRSMTGESGYSSKSKKHYSSYVDLNNPQLIQDYRRNQNRTFTTCIFEFVLTLIICGAMIGALLYYRGSDESNPRLLSKKETRLFNALMVGLGLALGFNLASSLKSYAGILRWVLLTKHWYDLETFDLLLGCAGQTKLIELVIKSWPFPRIWKLGQSPSKSICFFGILWLFINLSAQVTVATMSLFWPVEPSATGVVLTRGDVTAVNLERWVAGYRANEPDINVWEQAGAVNDWGLQAQDYQEVPYTSFEQETKGPTTLYYKENEFWEYRFDDRPVQSETNSRRWTNRYIRASAKCQSFELVDEGKLYPCTYSKNTAYETDTACFQAMDSQGNPLGDHYLPHYEAIPGGVTYMSTWVNPEIDDPRDDTSVENPEREYCGLRCNQVSIYQAGGSNDVTSNAYMLCNSTLSEVMHNDNSTSDFEGLSDDQRSKIYLNNSIARFGAGAIGLKGSNNLGNAAWTAVTYNPVLRWSPNTTMEVSMMEKIVSRFTIGTVAAMSDHGPRLTIKNQNNMPVQAQILQIDWSWIFTFMAALVGVQLVSVVLLISFAHKTIIRDDSYWSLAKLLMPVVQRLPDDGSTMLGHEIVKHSVFNGEKIAFGVRTTERGNKVDILWQRRGDLLKRASFQHGFE